MSDPIPSASTTVEEQQQLPSNAEDRKAAAALSSLNNGDNTDDSGSTNQEALGKAMSRLEIAAGQNKPNSKEQAAKKQTTPGSTSTQAAAEVKKKAAVKVAAGDVNLLAEELDLNKTQATELLKAHDGDARSAIRAFIAAG